MLMGSKKMVISDFKGVSYKEVRKNKKLEEWIDDE